MMDLTNAQGVPLEKLIFQKLFKKRDQDQPNHTTCQTTHNMYNHVNWPHPFDPRRSAIYALNDVDVKAPPEVVWKLLVDAENWSGYFPAEDQVKILTGEPELALGTKYSRVTVGFPMHLIVTECVSGRRLAWSTLVDGDETGSSAYHGWVITPTDTGCHLLSEETQQGPFFLEELGRKHPGGLYQYHQNWVETLARAAELEAAKLIGGNHESI